MCRKNRWNRGEHCSLSLSLVPLCVLWEKDNTCYLRWSYKEKFRIKFFELWYVFAHQWTVYLLRKRKYAIPELRRFVLHLILFIFLLLRFFSRFCLTFPSRIVFFSSRREWSKRTNERWTRRFFTKIFIRATKEMGKACFIFFFKYRKAYYALDAFMPDDSLSLLYAYIFAWNIQIGKSWSYVCSTIQIYDDDNNKKEKAIWCIIRRG